MVPFLGDYDTTEAVKIPFNTFSSDDPSASVTVTDLAAGDVEIHKDGGTTQRSSDNGVTVSIDFDSVTGNHIVSIDLSDNSDAGFYAAGSRYQVRLEGITVDGATLNVWIGTFSIGCTLRPATAGRTLVVDAAGLADANTVKSGPTGSGTAQTANDNGADINTLITQIGTAGAGLTDLGGMATGMKAEVNAECDTALSDYDGPTKAEMDTAHALLTTPAQVAAALATYDAPTKAELDSGLAGLNDLSAAEVNAECDTALSEYDGPTKAEMDTAHALLTTPAQVAAALATYDAPTKAELDSGLAGLNDLSAAEVNAEIVDGLATDTYAEPGQESPGATVSLSTKISYIYKFLRNKITNDGATTKVYNDAGAVVDQKATVSEAAGTVTRGEFGTGP